MMTEKADRPLPIYVSYSTFTTFLDWVAEMEVTPTQFDRSLWSGKFAGGTGAQLVTGLRFLGLLDGVMPTQRLDPLVRATPEERKRVVREVLEAAYGSQLIDGLKAMTPKMLNDSLTQAGATDATRRKAFSFLVNAAKANDIPIAKGIAKKARSKPSARKASGARKIGAKTSAGHDDATAARQQRSTGNTRTVHLASGGTVTLGVLVNLMDLSAADRDWLFKVIDLVGSYDGARGSSPDQQHEAVVGNT
jgi:hypothetical protein